MKIAWTRLALEGLEHARMFIAAERPSAAVHVIERIKKAVHSVSRYPENGRSGRVAGTRELIVSGTPFIVPYRIRHNRVEIIAVIHGARRWPDAL
ncbi:MAG: hypothetical protein A3A86_00375 [Elusimicrobia bacterium RIFCSPLOWO2_01_FULL_60_11]|nr:MAG: hypothetical protein A3A86_00375 [Elusimicrobia bacterium RIFCSPLOWO2_01_FULL_60_11]